MRRRDAWILVICAVLTNTVSFLDRNTLTTISPSVIKGLDIDQTMYGFALTAFACSYLIASPFAGRMLERIGARRGLLIAVLVWSTVSGLHALAVAYPLLLAMRAALGVAESPCLPGASQVIVRALPPPSRARAFGLLFIGSSLGGICAAPIAGYFDTRWGWQSAFLATATIGLAWVPIWLAVAFRQRSREVIDRPTEKPAGAPPASLRAVLRDPIVLRGVLTVFFTSLPLSFPGGWGSQLLSVDFHIKNVTHYNWLPSLGIDVGGLFFGDLMSRRYRRRGVGPDPAALTLALFLVTLGTWGAAASPDPWLAMISLGLILTGATGVYTVMLAETTAHVPHAAAMIAGSVTAVQALAFIVVSPLIGWIGDRTGTHIYTLVGLGFIPVATWVFAMVTLRRRPAVTAR
jgi:ACS family hexuronate transporter-like MFS transporter